MLVAGKYQKKSNYLNFCSYCVRDALPTAKFLGEKCGLNVPKLHIQIRFPVFLNTIQQILEKGNVNRPVGFDIEWHSGFFGCAVAFLYVTVVAGCNQVFPAIGPAAAFGKNMIESEVRSGSAVLTSTSVSFHYVSA